jgi:ABC-type multidrug transport system fused ATPase/permease subunit
MQEYIDERITKQREWYEKKANDNKSLFFTYQTIIIILGATIPVIVAVAPHISFITISVGPITAFISAIISIVAGMDKLRQPQPNWFNFRANEEMMKKEEWLYKYRAGVYKGLADKEANLLIVERIESIISADIARITSYEQKSKKDGKAEKSTAPESKSSVTEVKPLESPSE